MAFLAASPAHAAIPAERRPSIMRRVFNAIVEARMASAQRQVNAHLMTLDDATLAKYGVTRDVRRASAGYRSIL